MNSKAEMQTVAGLPTARGFAIGPVFVYRGDGEIPIPEFQIEEGRENDEVLRFRRAVADARRDIENLVSVLRERSGREDVRVFEGHLMFLEDPSLVDEAERLVRHERLNAEAAVKRVADGAREQFGRMNDPYFRERVRDIEDVERRILKALVGFSAEPLAGLKSPAIIVADDLTPSETVQLPREFVLGFATNGGSTTSHVALLARAMGIPAVSGLGSVTELVTAGETILLDGTTGTVTVHPTRAEILAFGDLIERQKELSEELATGRLAGALRGGGDIRLYANLHPGAPLDDVRAAGARGIGLYRSEYLWLSRELEPSEDEQFEAYRAAVEFANSLGPDSSTTIRVLDIGGDKLVRGISTKEANPFLGNRSIRYLLSHREVMLAQLRAILRASAFGKTYLLYPMVSCVEELRAAAAVLDEARRSLDAAGIAYDRELPVGAMIEVPAAALNAEALARHVDFFSIGTNDLIQYTMAADRGNDAVANLYQPTNPAILKLMRGTIAAAKRNGIRVGVCGESASDPIVGVLWAAMGIDMLSMSATYLPVMSKLFSRLSREDLDAYAQVVDACGDEATATEIFDACAAWMRAKIPDLDNIVL